MDELRDSGPFADADLPRKFADNEIRAGIGGLEVSISFPEIICCRYSAHFRGGQRLANTDVVPMAVVFAEIANAFVRIEQNVFGPVVADSFDLDAAPLESDDFVVGAAQLSARAQRNQRLDFTCGGFELLKNRQVGIFGVEDGMAAPAHDRFGLPERTKRDGRAALGTIQCLRLRLRRSGEWWSARAHHQPSKLRRFFNLRSSNSTNSP